MSAGRMALVAALCALALACKGSASAQSPPSGTEDARPNFLVLVTDDMRANDLNALPRLRAMIADQGTTFEDAFTTTPVCCPARTTILRGQYAHNHGVRTVLPPLGGIAEFKERRLGASTLATWLDAAGYKTGLVGKYLNGYSGKGIPAGWDSWDAWTGNYSGVMNHDGKLRFYGRPAEEVANGRHHTDVVAREAEQFLREAGEAGRPDEPFFLYVADLAPHDPNVPAARHAGEMDGAPMYQPPSWFEEDLSDKPVYMRKAPVPKRWRMAEEYRMRVESLLSVEDSLERMFAALEETDQLDDTYILFTSDNGYLLGEHRIRGKSVPYEESIRVPLLARGPGVPAGAVRDDLVALNDVAPTVAELAGVDVPTFVDGRSLVPLLHPTPGDNVVWRDALLLEQWREEDKSGFGVPTYRAVRSEDALYVEYKTGARELYDLSADPYQLENLAGQEPADEADLRSRLKALSTCAGASCRAAENRPTTP